MGSLPKVQSMIFVILFCCKEWNQSTLWEVFNIYEEKYWYVLTADVISPIGCGKRLNQV